MKSFKRVIEDCGLTDILFRGSKFMWSRGKRASMILERLDRGLASKDWFILFPKVSEKHLSAIYFDHVPILFYISDQ